WTSKDYGSLQSYDLTTTLGGAATDVATQFALPMFFAKDGDTIYVSSWGTASFYITGAGPYDGTLDSVALGTGPVTSLGTSLGRPSGLAVANGVLYHAMTDDSKVTKRPLPSGATSTLAPSRITPFRVAADATYVYWTSYGTYGNGYDD